MIYICYMKKLILLIVTILCITSCKTVTKTVEVPVETIKKEYIHDTKIDSVIVRDSIDRWHSGDTTYIYKEHTKYKYILKKDTLIKTDTIPKIITVTKENRVEVNHIYWWQKLLMWLGGILVLLLITYTIYKTKIK